MRVFVTGASGWIGSHTVDELVANGHDVVGLVRSDVSAASVAAQGATVLRGDLDDLDSIRRGAADAEAVVHLANKHDWADPRSSDRAERGAVQAILDVLDGTDRAFLLASGTAMIAPGRVATEEDALPAALRGPDGPRGGTEHLALDHVERGVRAISLRFAPTVHGTGDHGFISLITQAAQQRGESSYPGDGTNRWSAVHVSDAARMIRLGLEQAPAGSVLHAAGEEAVSSRAIAEAIGAGLGLPVTSVPAEDAVAAMGFIGRFFALDIPASSARTQALLGWTPTGPTLVEDIAAGAYFPV